MLKDTTRTTSALKSLHDQNKNFKQILKLCLRWMNVFLRQTEKISSRYVLAIDILKIDNVDSSTRLISNIGHAGTLEASGYDPINQMFFVLGAISDTFWEDFELTEVIKSFTDYVDLVRFIHEYKLSSA